MSLDELLEALPDNHRKHLDPVSPVPVRGMAAKGLVPLPPREMVIVLAGLTLDADAKIAESAQASLAKLPDKILMPALGAALPAAALEKLVPVLAGRDELLEPLVLNRATPDDVIALVARAASERVGEIVANNQERCLRSRAIVDALRGNANMLRSSLDRLFDFLVRSGVLHDDMPELHEAMARLSPTEMEQAVQQVELPPEAQALVETAQVDHAAIDAAAESAAQALDSTNPQERERIPTLKLIASLNVAQRVALAVRGNKEARSILVRDPNKMVASATIRSPRITEQEVVMAATSRSVADEVIRIIANTKEMTRSYAVKLALVNNPKTPLPTAMRMLTLLRENDVRNIAKSKNVPASVSTQARRLIAAKSQKG